MIDRECSVFRAQCKSVRVLRRFVVRWGSEIPCGVTTLGKAFFFKHKTKDFVETTKYYSSMLADIYMIGMKTSTSVPQEGQAGIREHLKTYS